MIKLYDIVKWPARWCFMIYCRRIKINLPEVAKMNGPTLLVVNHPNSFLDAMILSVLFKKCIHSLARGDVFKKPLANFVLRQLLVYPVYREREGSNLVSKNYDTFNECIEFFKKDKIVLIFVEGTSEPEWRLRALKKGAARLAIMAWEQNIPLKILPVAINYDSYHQFGKSIIVNFGNVILKNNFNINNETSGNNINAITKNIKENLEPLVMNLPMAAKQNFDVYFKKSKVNFLIELLGKLGKFINFPFYYPFKKYLHKKLFKHGHYESGLFGVMVVLYPIYLLLISFLFSSITPLVFIQSFLWVATLFPLLAYCYVRTKTD